VVAKPGFPRHGAGGGSRAARPMRRNGFVGRFELTYNKHKMKRTKAQERPHPCTLETAK